MKPSSTGTSCGSITGSPIRFTILSHPFPPPFPATTNEVCVYDGGRFLAASFLDIGRRATSAIYAMFEPELSARSLGIFMILKEIEYSIEQGMEHFHLGYSYEGPSFYDYKKRFRALEAFDWRGNWTEYKSG